MFQFCHIIMHSFLSSAQRFRDCHISFKRRRYMWAKFSINHRYMLNGDKFHKLKA
jgi:hypothetical protein